MVLVIGSIIFTIIVFLIIFFITKKIIKTLIFGMLIILIFFGISGFIVVGDFRDLVEKFPESENKIIFVLDNEVVGGMNLKEVDFISSYNNQTNVIRGDELGELNKNYPSNLNLVLGESYKLFIVDADIIRESVITNNIEDGIDYLPSNGKEALTIIRQEDPLSYYYEQYLTSKGLGKAEIEMLKEEIIKDKEISSIFEDPDTFKNYLILSHFINSVNNDNQFILENFLNGNIIIYPETITIKIIKEVPSIASKIIFKE